MPVTADVLRIVLIAGIIAMALIALAFLSTRRLQLIELLICSLVLVGVPLLGPFFVILFHPGQPRRQHISHRQRTPQTVGFLADSWLQKFRLR